MDAELEYEIATAIQFEISYKTNLVIGGIKNNTDWIFTSVNAVKSIQLILAKYQKKFEQKIHCVGNQAYALLSQLGYFSITKFGSEEELTKSIDWSLDKSYTYFCSNNLKNILPQDSNNYKSTIDYIEVYKTIQKNPKIKETNFDHIFFFSPLAVRSILRKNPELKNCHAICIGPATERVVKELGVQKYSMVNQPNLKSMVQMVLNI